MKIFNLEEIKSNLCLSRDLNTLIDLQKSAFIDFTSDLYDVPPPMQYVFPDFKGDSHVKGGYKKGSETFVLKIANSSSVGNNGLILIFDVKTGETKAILQDQGFLTTLRTAVAGIIVAQLTPWEPKKIGIVGSGSLASQIHTLCKIKFPNSERMLYARDRSKASLISNNVCDSIEELKSNCDILYTCTSSNFPLIDSFSSQTHQLIIGLGSDSVDKVELDRGVFEESDLVIVDSLEQSMTLGDSSGYLRSDLSHREKFFELGKLLQCGINGGKRRLIADLSGIGSQDVSISEFILQRLL